MNSDFGTNRDAVFGRAGSVPGVSYDAGLRQYMLSIYNNMTAGVGITGVLAWLAGNSDAYKAMVQTVGADGRVGMSALGFVIALAPIGLALLMGFGARAMSAAALRTTFFIYSAVMGLSLSTIFWVYTDQSIARTFFITAATFGAMSLWGYSTKRDLTGFGHFLLMGLVGIVLASIINIFLQSSGLQFAVSVLGVLLFTGMTAYDTQQAKYMYQANAGTESTSKLATFMALQLYMDFINLFLYLLRFFGQQRDQ